jgi:hypothetical protein
MITSRIFPAGFGLARRTGRARRSRQFLPSLAPSMLEKLEVRCVPTILVGPTSLPKLGTSAVFTELDNGTIQAVITNTSNSTVTVALASYKNASATGDLNLLNQKRIDVESAVLRPGQSVTLVVQEDKNGCTQGDAYATDHTQVDCYVGSGALKGDDLEKLAPKSFTSLAQASQNLIGGLVVCQEQRPKGNEGLGNGVDPPPPGHAGDSTQNDVSGTPGDPNHGFNQS